MWKKVELFLKLLAIFAFSFSYADITGNVFQDLPVNGSSLNKYGVKDSNELGVKGIVVKAFDENNTEVAETTTDANGDFTLNTPSGNYRVEFSNIPSYLEESANTSVVQFVSDGGSVNLALHNPDDYSSTPNPPYVSNRQTNGAGISDNNASIETMGYNYNGLNQEFYDAEGNQGTGEIPVVNAVVSEVGSTWGKAYQKSKKRLFVASVLQRHVGLAHDLGSVYIIDYSNANDNMSGVYSGYFTLQERSASNGGTIDLGSVQRSGGSDYELPDNPDTPNIDLDAFGKVGKVGFGDIDFDQREQRLWLVNLNQKALISIDASGDDLNNSDVKQYLLSDIPNTPTCNGGELRPWALTIHNNRGYLGALCDASDSNNSSDLVAYVLSFDLNDPTTNGFKEELSFNLSTYNRPDSDSTKWQAWSDTYQPRGSQYWQYYPQPMITDIEFDEKGNIYLAFNDRYGMQAGCTNYPAISGATDANESTTSFGDILKVCSSESGYILEGNDGCMENVDDKDGDGVAEFFYDEGGDGSSEYIEGALALIKGRNELIASTVDPHPAGDTGKKYWNTQGFNRLSLSDGNITNWYSEDYSGYSSAESKSYAKYNGKASGVGDVEFITDAAPIEVGDRVWFDANANGIQDANEEGIANVKVELVCNGVVEANVTTDENGYYLFSNDANGVDSSSKKYGIEKLQASNPNNCLIRVPDISGANTQAALVGKYLTVSNNSSNDEIDSDGVANDNSAEVTIEADDIKIDGANNHSFDFGFIQHYCIGDYVWEDLNANGIQDDNEKGIEGVVVKVYDSSNNEINSTTSDSNGAYKICNLEPNRDYIVEFEAPATYEETLLNSGSDDSKDSDVNNSKVEVSLGSSDNYTIDAGYYKRACLGDYVWYDSNKNGLQDSSESGIANVEITLYDADSNSELNTTTTDSNGVYSFCSLKPGAYYIKVTKPDGYSSFSINDNSDDTKNSDVNSSGVSKSVVLNSGDDYKDLDAGLIKGAAAITINKYTQDSNGEYKDADDANGSDVPLLVEGNSVKWKYVIVNSGEQNLSDVTLKDDKEGDITDCVDENNNSVSLPANLEVSKTITCYKEGVVQAASSGEYENNATVSAKDSDNNTISSSDLSHYKVAPRVCIGDYVWEDLNANGIQDDNEKGIEGVVVKVYDSSNNEINSTTSDSNGAYKICNLEPNRDYIVKIIAPKDYYLSNKNQGGDAKKDSDFDPQTKELKIKLIASNFDIDAGLFKSACVGDYAWIDSNLNGIQDENESGIGGVELTLLDDNGERAKDINGSLIEDITTNSSGKYEFCNLKPGIYQVKVKSLPDGYYLTKIDTTSDDKDSDVEVNGSLNKKSGLMPKLALNSGESNPNFDVGVYKAACISNKVWIDSNKNGIYDDGEEPLSDVNVTLYIKDANGDFEVAKDINGNDAVTITNSEGDFKICDLLPNQEYYISFYKKDENGELNNTQLAQETIPTPVTLGSGQDYPILSTNDTNEGLCIGDLVWYDKNLNGIFDEDINKYGVSNIKVHLYDENGNELQTTVTDSKGRYSFCNLKEGNNYRVKFDLPQSYHATLQNVGDDESIDSDASSNGEIYISASDLEKVKEPFNGGYINPTFDVGIYCDCDDYKVHPENHKDLKADAFNVIATLFFLLSLTTLVMRKERERE